MNSMMFSGWFGLFVPGCLFCKSKYMITCFFPECVARVPVSLWGSGGEAVFAKSCVCGRNRRQMSATLCVSAVTLSTLASAAARGLESVSSWLVSPQLYWRLQRKCQCEWSVASQFYWRLQRKCQCDWSVAPQLFWRLQRKCQCEWSCSPQFYWHLQRKCQCGWSVSGKSVLQECQARVSHEIVPQECQVRASYKNLKKETCKFPSSVSSKSVIRVSLLECPATMSSKDVM